MLVLMNSIGAWLKVNIGCHPAAQRHFEEWKEREKFCSLPLLHLNDLISVESPHLQLAVEVAHREGHQLLVCDPTLKEVKL